MGKTLPLYPEKEKEKDVNLPSAAELYGMLRAVADGDETARQALKELLDILEQTGVIEEFLSMNEPEIYFDTEAQNIRELHIRIKLNNIDVSIWRELKVPSHMRLDSFAEILLDAMGWMHEHMYAFHDGRTEYCMEEALEDNAWMSYDCLNMTEYTVGDLFIEKGRRLKFEYDFGDGWVHDVWLKGEREYEKDEKMVVSCFKGRGLCPPEDCGGVWGYQDLIELAQKKRLTKDDIEKLEWYDLERGFDPNDYDAELYEFEHVLGE